MGNIGTIGSIKVTENGMIANINLDNTFRNKVIIEIYKLEDRISMLEFKYLGIEQMKKDLDADKNAWLIKAFSSLQKKIQKEIKSLQKTIRNYGKLFI